MFQEIDCTSQFYPLAKRHVKKEAKAKVKNDFRRLTIFTITFLILND